MLITEMHKTVVIALLSAESITSVTILLQVTKCHSLCKCKYEI